MANGWSRKIGKSGGGCGGQRAVQNVRRGGTIRVQMGKPKLAKKNRWPVVLTILVNAATLLGLYLAFRSLPPAPGKLEVNPGGDIELSGLITAFHLPVRIVWDGTLGQEIEVKRLKVRYVFIRNVGAQPLEWDRQVRTPLRFATQGDGRLLSVSQQEGGRVPSKVVIAPGWKEFEVSADFLNPGESIVLAVCHTSDGITCEQQRAVGDALEVLNFDAYFFWRSPAVAALIAQGMSLLMLIIWSFLVFLPRATQYKGKLRFLLVIGCMPLLIALVSTLSAILALRLFLGVEALMKPQQNIQFAHLALTFVLVVVALRLPPYARRSRNRTTSSAPTADAMV
jgi:hypothetical protein